MDTPPFFFFPQKCSNVSFNWLYLLQGEPNVDLGMSECLLLFVIAGAAPATDPDIIIWAEGEWAYFPCMSSCRENSSALYRVSGDEDLLPGA